MKRKLFSAASILMLFTSTFSQNSKTNNFKDNRPEFTIENPFEQKAFIENSGDQFDQMIKDNSSKILYSTRVEGVYLYFTTSGVVYRYDKFPKLSEEQRERIEHSKGMDIDVPKVKTYFFSATWKDANPNVVVSAEDKEPFYYTYPKGENQTILSAAYKKIVYKDLYPNIDIQYYFPQDKNKKGIKYNIIVHPGGDLTKVKLIYEEAEKIKINEAGDIEIKSEFGKFTDHAPSNTYYQDNNEKISCSFMLDKEKNEVSFNLKNYDNSRIVIIDPWTQNPGFTGYNSAYDVNYDVQGNVYICGSYQPFQLSKYNSAGVFQWTYNATQFNNTGSILQSPCYGGFAVDFNTGRSYFGEGFNSNGARILKVSSAGALLATFGGNTNLNEIWRVRYNKCINTIVLAAGSSSAAYQAAIVDTSLATLTPVNVLPGSTAAYHDMVGIAIDNTNGFCYMATAQTSGSEMGYDNKLLALPIPNLVPISYMVNDGYAFNEVNSVTYVNGGIGYTNAMNCMAVSPNWVYMHDGKKLTRYNKSSGATMGSSVIGSSSYNWGGIDVDQCDNLFIGNNTNINILDSSFVQTGNIAAGGRVYDVKLGLNGMLYACGQGFVSTYSITSNNITLSTTQTPAACSACNGSATVQVNSCGHIAPAGAFSYQWNNGQTTQTATGLCAGQYTVTVSSNCNQSYSTTVIVNSGGGTFSLTSTSATLCVGNSAPLTASGTGAVSYTWSPGTGLSSTSGSSVIANPTTTTVYTVTSTDGSGCMASSTSTVTVNPSPTVTVNSGSICSGNSITLNAGGASTYTWSPGTGLSSTNGSSVSANPTVTTTYTITGASASGCTNTATSIVTVNPMPTLTVNSATICPNATVTLTANGASTYTWSTGATTASITENPASTTNYTVIGTATGGCVSTATTSITVVSNLVISVNSATICAGNSTTLNASGAATYSWSPATGLSSTTGASVIANPTVTTTYTITGSSGTCSAVATATVTVNPGGAIAVNSGTICTGNSTTLNAGGASTYTWSPGTGLSSTNGASVTANPTTTTNYTVIGTDVNGCVFTTTTSVNVNPLPTITATNATICNGGSATLTANGANTYTWSPAATLNSANGSSVTANPTSTTQYTITGTDANGCINTDTTSVTVVNNAVVTVNSSTICTGGSATLTASGATTYTWSPAATLSSSTGSTVTANPVATTVYTITATAGTCTATGTSTVTVVANSSVTVNSASICNGSSATLTASGANTYTWSPAATLSSANGSSVTANPTTTTVYTINATLGTCNATGTTTVTVNPLPNVSSNPGFICNGGSTTLTANGASTYIWSPAATLSSSTGSSVTASPTVTTQYTITGTDINGCVNTGNTSVTVVTNPTISVNAASICAGQQTATLTALGASSFNWSPGTGLSSTSGSSVIANPSTTTTYTIIGTIGTCTATATSTVTVYALPVVTATSNAPICVNGTLNLNSSGGTNYSWNGPSAFSSSQQNPSITGVSNSTAGIYTVTVTDGNSCTNSATVNVVINSLPVVTANGGTVCVNSTISLTATGGTNYSWSGPNSYSSNQQNPNIANATGAMTGSYFVTVTDANGCANGNVAQVVVNPLPSVTANSATICAVGSASLYANGANTYTWSPSTGLSNNNGASVTSTVSVTTNYTVTGSDINGCQNSAPLTVYVNPLPQVAVGPLTTSGCVPLCVDFSNITSSTGNCSWNFGDGNSNNTTCTPRHCFTSAGSFAVTLTFTDVNGCSNTASSSVSVYPQPQSAFYSSPQPTSILEPTVHFTDNSSGAVISTWNWTFGDPLHGSSTNQNPTFYYTDAGSYPVQLIVTSDHGCKDSTVVIITIDEEFAIYVPNAFTPNFDGSNDVFMPKGEGIKDYKLMIFDRWGNKVFYSDDLYKGWDGRFQSRGEDIVQEDVYVWKIELKNEKGMQKYLSGTVSLLK